ncbi:MAG TPA: hypothetical protein VFM54_24400 [Micromonosporaceae bacterium]|nr:hypothetical protein [Micromonosporaceae bacterium]
MTTAVAAGPERQWPWSRPGAVLGCDGQPRPGRAGRALVRTAAVAGQAWRALADAFSAWDAICAVGLLMLLGGLCFWVGPAAAFAGVGGLVLTLGIAGGRAAARAAAGQAAGDAADGPPAGG